MKALTLVDSSTFEFGEAHCPEPKAGEVRIAVAACGICGSDVHGMDGSSGRRLPPIVMGHEAAGVIDLVGQGVTQWKRGDRVTFDSTLYCGECPSCQSGQVNLCADRRVLGVSCGEYCQPGAFADYVVVPDRVLYALPDTLGFEEACFVEPVSVALHAVSRIPIAHGASAVVIGAGIIGLLVIQAFKVAGCASVIAVDLDTRRLALARDLGADEALLSDPAQVRQRIGEITAGAGADVAMEVVGMTPTVQLALGCVRKGGAVGLVGNLAPEVNFPLQEVVTRELSVFGSCASAGEYGEALARIADGSIRVKPLVSAVADLAEGAEWFARLHKNTEGLTKVILRPPAFSDGEKRELC